MTHFTQLSVRAPQQSIGEVRAPGIVGLFIQGLQTGLVIAQLAQWLNLKRTESASMIALVAFVTVIGLLETGVCFASAWRTYVSDFGQFIYPHWTEAIHVMLILKRKIYLIVSLASQITELLYLSSGFASPEIPLVLALICSVVLTAWVTAYLFGRLSSPRTARPEDYHPSATTIWWPFVACLAVPATLDVVITSILLYSLTTFLRRIHTEQLRGRIMRFIVVVWQAAIPPGLCAVALVIKYMVFTETHPGQHQKWYGTIQAMLGKFYILSLFYTLPPVTYASTVDPSSLESAGSPARRYVYSWYNVAEIGLAVEEHADFSTCNARRHD
ncbi:hypothetical protein BJY52DRAFT_1364630 [Lactarius psammicola]|nr:hypothetical protein BJY52DRAFT_1364630 [Lactarius psammicola]